MRFTVLLVLILSTSAASAQDSFSKTLKDYQYYVLRPPFRWKGHAWLELAKSQDERAFQYLAKDYTKPPDPKEQVRYLIASAAGMHLVRNFEGDPFLAWSFQQNKSDDAWLRYRALWAAGRNEKMDIVLERARTEKDIWLRAAAIEAAAAWKDAALLDLLRHIHKTLPKKGIERTVAIESMAAVLLGLQARTDDAEFQAVATPIIQLIDDPKVEARSKLVLIRYLAKLFRSDSRARESGPWINQMKAGVMETKSDHGYDTTFFSLRASGDRIAYVIDMSDSMLTPLSGAVTKRGGVTGPGKGKEAEEPKEPQRVSDDDIPWHKVKNRFDVAREYIKLSLSKMKPNKSFTIVGFGTAAEFIGATGFLPATPANVKAAIKALDAIRPGVPIEDRPHGTLMGYTNLHGGILLAYRAYPKKVMNVGEYISEVGMMEGADTLFILSDGDPTYDNWPEVDIHHPGVIVGDPETRTTRERQDNIVYYGPYFQWDLILDDVQRMNLFRRCEIHCIGVGEAQMNQLKKLADIGFGETQQVGL